MKRTTSAVWHEKYNRWQINVQKDGERKSFYSSIVGREGKRVCHQKADEWLDENITRRNTRISDLYSEYVENLKLSTSKSNWVKAESIGANWILPNVGKSKIETLTEQKLQNIINKAFAAKLAKKSLMNIRATIMNFLKFCRKSNVCMLRPEELEIPKGAKVNTKRILQPNDLITLFANNKTQKYGKEIEDIHIHAYRFLVLTGLRPGELIALERANVQDGVLKVTGSINVYNEHTKGKNDNAVRRFVLTDSAQKELDAQPLDNSSKYIFGDLTLSGFSSRWTAYCAYNNIPHISLYELRHTFVSVVKNLPAGQIKALVGHSKNMDTFGTYSHEINGELEQTAIQIESLFSNILNNSEIK